MRAHVLTNTCSGTYIMGNNPSVEYSTNASSQVVSYSGPIRTTGETVRWAPTYTARKRIKTK
jgi:hypothetical protein